jgi:hypothetical protein
LTDEQLPLFEAATEPLQETEDIAGTWISWDELQEKFGWDRANFIMDDFENSMSPHEPTMEELEDLFSSEKDNMRLGTEP